MGYKKVGLYREIRDKGGDMEYATITIPGRKTFRAKNIIVYMDNCEGHQPKEAYVLIHGDFSAKGIMLATNIIYDNMLETIKDLVKNDPAEEFDILEELAKEGFEEDGGQ